MDLATKKNSPCSTAHIEKLTSRLQFYDFILCNVVDRRRRFGRILCLRFGGMVSKVSKTVIQTPSREKWY